MEQAKLSIEKIVLAIVITAIVVGSGVYMWQKNQVSQPVTKEVTKEVTKVEKENIRGYTANNELHYKNDTYGFSLDFPKTWKDYTVTELERDRTAGTPAVASFRYTLDNVVLTITAYTEEQYKVLTAAHPNGSPYSYNAKIAQNDSFFFVGYGDQDAETSMYPRSADVYGILKTFAHIPMKKD